MKNKEDNENNNIIFSKLLKLQSLIKKESSLKELCKEKNIIDIS